MNAVNGDMVTTLRKVFRSIGEDEDIQVVVLEGAGGNFLRRRGHGLAGGGEIRGPLPDDHEIHQSHDNGYPRNPPARFMQSAGRCRGRRRQSCAGLRFCPGFTQCPVPGGLYPCGRGPGRRGTFFLPRLVGLAKAKELAMLGEAIDGKTAASMGLIYKSVNNEALDEEVAKLVETLAARSSKALASIKQGLDASLAMSLAEVLEREAVHQSILFQTTEHKQAVKRFLKSRRE